MIAVFIKTCPGRFSLQTTINSILWSLKDTPYRLYIADESPVDDWKMGLYEKLKNDGHYIHIFNEKTSVNSARNHLLDALGEEKFILRMDDDFELGGEFSIEAMLSCLNARDDIALCASIERQIGGGKFVSSGMLRLQADSKIKNETLTYKYKMNNNWNYYSAGPNYKYAFADHTRNLFLLKRKCAEMVRWDERILFEGEHDDFQLSLLHEGFKLCFTPNSIHLHRDDLKQKVVNVNDEKNARKEQVEEVKHTIFMEKWGFNKIKSVYPVKFYLGRKLFNLIQSRQQ